MTQSANPADKPSIGARLKKEFYKYGLVSGYLFVSFSMLRLFEVSASGGTAQALHFSLALVQALVLGKFLLIGEALNAGSRADRHPMLVRVAWRSLALLAVLLVLKALEELIIGLVHDKSVMEVVSEVMNRTALENFAPVIIMLLILIPLISISESFRQLGADGFRALWLSHPDGHR